MLLIANTWQSEALDRAIYLGVCWCKRCGAFLTAEEECVFAFHTSASCFICGQLERRVSMLPFMQDTPSFSWGCCCKRVVILLAS